MYKKQVISTLIKYAAELDNLGLHNESDELTRIAQNFGEDFSFPEENERTPFIDDSMLKADDYQDLADFNSEEEFDIPVKDKENEFIKLLSDSGADVIDNIDDIDNINNLGDKNNLDKYDIFADD